MTPEAQKESGIAYSDEELLTEGLRLCHDDQIIPGARLLRQISNEELLNDDCVEFLRRADLSEKLRKDLTEPIEEGWIKQGESHGDRDFITYYKVGDAGRLKCRIESVIESSLYVPFLATMNETDLYETWFPRWKAPFKLGIHRSIKLKQKGRCEQIVQLTVDLPYPLNKREIVFFGYAEEDITLNNDVGAKLYTVDEGFDGVVPPPEKKIVRMDFEADFYFRRCPENHPALLHSKTTYPEEERLMLLTFVLYADPKIRFVPQSVMNFCTRTAIGGVWRMILRISEEVREGKRPAHAELIEAKREELYDWMEERAQLMVGLGDDEEEEDQEEFEDEDQDKEEEYATGEEDEQEEEEGEELKN